MSVSNELPVSRHHQTTKERCRIFHIGLDVREALVIESVFRANPELAARYVFGPPPEGESVDLMFVNGDDDDAQQSWRQLHELHPDAVAVMVSLQQERHAGEKVLVRPLKFRDFSVILDTITSVESLRSPDIGADSPAPLRLLVVDDSFPARQFMKFKLEELSRTTSLAIDVDFAECGETAVTMARDAAYDLVFLDVVMPGMDGYETCRQLKEMRQLRVAMLTGRTNPVDFSQGRAAGCDNYLSKPPNDVDLRAALRLTSLHKLTDSSRQRVAHTP